MACFSILGMTSNDEKMLPRAKIIHAIKQNIKFAIHPFRVFKPSLQQIPSFTGRHGLGIAEN